MRAPTSWRPAGGEDEPTRGSELTVLLWVIAILIAEVMLVWLAFARMYSS